MLPCVDSPSASTKCIYPWAEHDTIRKWHTYAQYSNCCLEHVFLELLLLHVEIAQAEKLERSEKEIVRLRQLHSQLNLRFTLRTASFCKISDCSGLSFLTKEDNSSFAS